MMDDDGNELSTFAFDKTTHVALLSSVSPKKLRYDHNTRSSKYIVVVSLSSMYIFFIARARGGGEWSLKENEILLFFPLHLHRTGVSVSLIRILTKM